MWRPPLSFISLHYAYITFTSILGIIVLYPYGNMTAVDTFFFGASASTESGLNTIDLKEMKTYQQLFCYFIPMITNLAFVNIVVIIVRLYWFKKLLIKNAGSLRLAGATHNSRRNDDFESRATTATLQAANPPTEQLKFQSSEKNGGQEEPIEKGKSAANDDDEAKERDDVDKQRQDEEGTQPAEPNSKEPKEGVARTTTISFAPDSKVANESSALYIPGPRERDMGHPIVEKDADTMSIVSEKDAIRPASSSGAATGSQLRPIMSRRKTYSQAIDTVESVAASMFVLGPSESKRVSTDAGRRASMSSQRPVDPDLPYLSASATMGRNSSFRNLTAEDREILGGIEYRSLKLLLKVTLGYFFGLHLLGALFLVPWIHRAPSKYTDYLASVGLDKTWWGFYSAQTMVSNLGMTLTPDSMISFSDATWPMLAMTFLAFAGNTAYPILLRCVIWIMYKIFPSGSSLKEPLDFLLKHPRRCYTLLFPSRPTWVLFGILFALNFVDVVFIICLDLDNPTVNELPVGPRILAALFQAASSRHTGTTSFNLADVNPAVQLSLMVMMYIAVLPISVSIRASNTYEEQSLGIFTPNENEVDETHARSYVATHLRNQLGFDMWYIFLGTFCIACAESYRIMDVHDPAFQVFSILFEVTSAYGNVGLSLGYPTVNTSLSGQFTTFSKLVICAMMIRGRHRGLPYNLDRAIMLPGQEESVVGAVTIEKREQGAENAGDAGGKIHRQ